MKNLIAVVTASACLATIQAVPVQAQSGQRTMTEQEWLRIANDCMRNPTVSVCDRALVEIVNLNGLANTNTRDISEKACEAGSGYGCEVHGAVWATVQNPVWARQFYERACQLGRPDGCSWVARYDGRETQRQQQARSATRPQQGSRAPTLGEMNAERQRRYEQCTRTYGVLRCNFDGTLKDD